MSRNNAATPSFDSPCEGVSFPFFYSLPPASVTKVHKKLFPFSLFSGIIKPAKEAVFP
jgi:hypothetical protein